ncbi:MAG: S9 family peptidase [Chloroflexota bacterium]|nr:S9 family peptidase [Chloroflexota bacterium]
MPGRLSLDDLVRLPLPGMDAPGRIEFVPGAEAVSYLQSSDGSLVRSLWRHDLATGERRLLAAPIAEAEREETLSRDEELRRQRRRTVELGVTDYAWAPRADRLTLLVPIAGRLYVASGEEPVREIAGVSGVQAARLSPDGHRIAYVVAGDLWVMPVEGGSATRITGDAAEGLFYGLPEFVAAEELDRPDGLWWSEDGALLTYARVDERGLPPFVIPHWGEDAAEVEVHRYPFAGKENAAVSLHVVAAGGGAQATTGIEIEGYLARVVAHPDGGWLVAVLSRDQRSLRWSVLSHDGTARELWVETSEPWLNLDDDTRVLGDGRILRSTEASGFRHLELRSGNGGLEQTLTAGEWAVAGVVQVDQELGTVLFVAGRDGVLQRHLYSISLEGGEPIRLTDEPGWHDVIASADGRRWADTSSSLEHGPRVSVRGRDRGRSIVIHESSLDTDRIGLPPPELLELTAADGITPLHAALYRPDATWGPPPLVVSVYGGPHSQRVMNAWSLTVDLRAQWLRQRGVGVLVVDNRGTSGRGLAFEAALARRMGSVEVDDQATAVRELVRRGNADAERIGLYGWSYGGYITLLCLAREPQLFRVGVAGAPVVDWDGYDTAYSERYLGTPEANPDAYRESSVLTRAGELRGQLLVVHGLLDENVHFRHTARLLARLSELGRSVDLLLLAGERHGPRGRSALALRERRTLEFLCRHLGVDANVS